MSTQHNVRVFLVIREKGYEGEETLAVCMSREAAEKRGWNADRSNRGEYSSDGRVYVREFVGSDPELEWRSDTIVPRSYSPKTVTRAIMFRQNPEAVRGDMEQETAKAARWARRFDLRVAC